MSTKKTKSLLFALLCLPSVVCGVGVMLSGSSGDVPLRYTAYLDPDGDAGTNDWTSSEGSPNHFSDVDDGDREPAVPGGTDYLFTNVNARADVFTLAASPAAAVTVESIQVWYYGDSSTTGPVVKADIYIAGAWVGEQDVGLSQGDAWLMVEFLGSWSKAEVDAAKVSIEMTGGIGIVYCWNLYCRISYLK